MLVGVGSRRRSAGQAMDPSSDGGSKVAPKHIAALRRHSKPTVDAMRLWFEAQLPLLSGRSTLAEAIRYALSRWEGLMRFLQ
jgi:transposase